MKALVRCPRCEHFGRTSILGELKPTGHFVIQRIYQYQSGKFHRKYTIIGGNDYFVLCDQCGERVYFRRVSTQPITTWQYLAGTFIKERIFENQGSIQNETNK